jgi:ribosomal-protein-serine acetyltransferase
MIASMARARARDQMAGRKGGGGVFLYPLGDDAGLGMLEPWHAEQFAAAVDQARAYLAPWVPFAHSVTDVDSARVLLQRLADRHAGDTAHLYGIWQDGQLIGGAVFPQFDTGTGICELGVWLVPRVAGRGLITKAARYLLDWAIRIRGMSRVEWHTNPENERSKAVARRLGMTCEGVLRSAFVLAGKREDVEIWSILAHEWLAGAATTGPFGAAPTPPVKLPGAEVSAGSGSPAPPTLKGRDEGGD